MQLTPAEKKAIQVQAVRKRVFNEEEEVPKMVKKPKEKPKEKGKQKEKQKQKACVPLLLTDV